MLPRAKIKRKTKKPGTQRMMWLIIGILISARMVEAQLIDYAYESGATASTSGTPLSSSSTDYSPAMAIDYDENSRFASYSPADDGGHNLQLYVPSGMSPRTVFINDGNKDQQQMTTIYVGDTSVSGDYMNENTACVTDVQTHGYHACDDVTGTYLIVRTTVNRLTVLQLSAYNYYNYVTEYSAVDAGLASVTEDVLGSAWGAATGVATNNPNTSTQFSGSGSAYIRFDFDPRFTQGSVSQVQVTWIYKYFKSSISDPVDFIIIDKDGAENLCGSMSNGVPSYQWLAMNCPTPLNGVALKITVNSSSYDFKIQSLAVFGPDKGDLSVVRLLPGECPTDANSITPDPTYATTQTFTGNYQMIETIVPSVTIDPDSCFNPTYDLVNSDGSALTTTQLQYIIFDGDSNQLTMNPPGIPTNSVTYNLKWVITLDDGVATQDDSVTLSLTVAHICTTGAFTPPVISDWTTTYGQVTPETKYFSPFALMLGSSQDTTGICGTNSFAFDSVGAIFFTWDNVEGMLVYTETADIIPLLGQAQTITMTASNDDYSSEISSSSSSFTFTVPCPSSLISEEITTTIEPTHQYDLGSNQAYEITLQEVTIQPVSCYELTEYVVTETATGLASSILTVDSSSGTVSILTTDASLGGTVVEYQVIARYTSLVDTSVIVDAGLSTFTVSYLNLCGDTSIVTTDLDTLVLPVDGEFEYVYDMYEVQMAIDSGTEGICGDVVLELGSAAPSYITLEYDQSQFTITGDGKGLNKTETLGFDLTASLVDYPGVRNVVQVVLDVTGGAVEDSTNSTANATEAEEVVVEVEEDTEQTLNAQAVNQVLDKFKDKIKGLRKSRSSNTNTDIFLPPKLFIRRISPQGVLQVDFSEDMQGFSKEELDMFNKLAFPIAKRQLSSVDSFEHPLVQIDVIPSEQQTSSKYKIMSYEVTEFEGKYMKVQMYFDDPLYVSFDESDVLKVSFSDPELIVSVNGVAIEMNETIKIKKIPRQTRIDEQSQQIVQTIESAAASTTSATISAVILNFILSASLNNLLGMVEAIQIIVFFPLLSTKMPANVGIFMEALLQIAAFDFIETGEYVELIFEIDPIEPGDDMNYPSLGIETVYFITNLGTAVFIFSIQIIGSLLYVILYPFRECGKYIKEKMLKLQRGLFWNNWLTTVKETFLVIALNAMIQFKYDFKFDSWGGAFQTISALCYSAFYLFLPTSILIFCLARFEHLEKINNKGRIGDFYDGLDLSKGRIVLLYNVVFYLRRLYIPWMIVYGSRNIVFQACSIIYMVIMQMSLLQRDYLSDKDLKSQEIVNEFVILIVMDGFFLFNHCTVETNNTWGYFVIFFTCFIFIYTFGKMFYEIFLNIRQSLRKRIALRNYAKWRTKNREWIKKTSPQRRRWLVHREKILQMFIVNDAGNGIKVSDESDTESSSSSSSNPFNTDSDSDRQVTMRDVENTRFKSVLDDLVNWDEVSDDEPGTEKKLIENNKTDHYRNASTVMIDQELDTLMSQVELYMETMQEEEKKQPIPRTSYNVTFESVEERKQTLSQVPRVDRVYGRQLDKLPLNDQQVTPQKKERQRKKITGQVRNQRIKDYSAQQQKKARERYKQVIGQKPPSYDQMQLVYNVSPQVMSPDISPVGNRLSALDVKEDEPDFL